MDPPNHLDLSWSLTIPLYRLYLTNMLRSSPNSPGVILHQIYGLLPPSAPFDRPCAMPKTSGNALTLLSTGPPSSLSANNTTSSYSFPKKNTTPALYLQPLTTPNVFGKQSTNFYTANPPDRYPPLLLALHFQTALLLFFTGKISKLHLSLTSNPATSSLHSPSPPATPPDFSLFTRASESEIHKILSNCPNKHSDSVPIPTWLLKECSSVLDSTSPILWTSPSLPASFILLLRNLSYLRCWRNTTLDKKELFNYRQISISKVSLIFKIIERVVKSRLMDHVTSNSLLNSHQSAYCKHHFTETALLYIHDHLVSAIGSQKVSSICLLDLSAAFDTIDHDILITRLSSWFGIHGSVLILFKSYLSSRCFRVKC